MASGRSLRGRQSASQSQGLEACPGDFQTFSGSISALAAKWVGHSARLVHWVNARELSFRPRFAQRQIPQPSHAGGNADLPM